MTTKCSKKYDPELSSRQYGVELSRLTSEERTVPQLVEKLINYIEMHGLYTEGIYRKSGSTNKIKELRLGLDTDVNVVNLDDYNIHVIASVLKQWLRDLPSPLMTFELYEEFLRAMGQSDRREVITGVYSVIDQLSRTHLSTLERLIFHLVSLNCLQLVPRHTTGERVSSINGFKLSLSAGGGTDYPTLSSESSPTTEGLSRFNLPLSALGRNPRAGESTSSPQPSPEQLPPATSGHQSVTDPASCPCL
ncbi:unconventional myosin-IXa-like [Notothenia coriiceps]|uniref:Unconventional myosin-IXa-like n=1 Tax=Notothenia coriiceps TaxID=8208 RepID=A0A6I9NJ22_9TELE|nr:PREDICTED: unconventional myosin-IXa-like [Notothenia coriiceps]